MPRKLKLLILLDLAIASAVFFILPLQTQSSSLIAPTAVEGSLKVFHKDYPDGRSENEYYLITSAGEEITLHPENGFKDYLESRTEVKVEGRRIGNNLWFDASREADSIPDLEGGITVISQPGNPPVLGDQKTLVILINYTGSPTETDIKPQVRNTVFTEIAAYFREISHNKINLVGDVVGWYTLPMSATCPVSGIVPPEALKAASAVVNIADYSRLVLIPPSLNCGGVSGLSTTGKTSIDVGGTTYLMSVSSVDKWRGQASISADISLAHEMLHGFGLGHANFTIAEDRDDFQDPLGRQRGFLNAPHLQNLGWLSPTNIELVAASGRYTIEPLETATGGKKILKLRSGIGYLYAEYRQPIGSDSAVNLLSGGRVANVFQGALLHVPGAGAQSFIVPALTPVSTTDFALPPGRTYTDPTSGTSITTVSAGAAGLTVDVTLGVSGAPFDSVPPAVSVATPSAGSTVSGLVDVTANASDANPIAGVYYKLDNYNLLAEEVSSAPYRVSWNSVKVPNGSHAITPVARDFFGNLTEGAPITVTVANASLAISASPTVSAITASGANIFWTTNVPSDSQVEYGTSAGPPYTSETPLNSSLVASHSAALSGLSPAITYHYRVKSSVGGVTAHSLDATFTTLSAAPLTVAVTAPASGATISGVTSVSATVSDVSSVLGVIFKIDGATIGEDLTAPYSVSLNTVSYADGSHILTATARVSGGTTVVSPSVTVTVNNSVGALALRAAFASAVKTTQAKIVVFFPGGTSSSPAVQYGPTTAYGSSAALSNLGPFNAYYYQTLTGLTPNSLYHFRVTDSSGASSDFTFRTAQSTADVTLPTVTQNSIGTNLSGTVNLSASASDNVSVAAVQFMAGSSAIFEDAFSPYGASWNTAAVSNGMHVIFALARDSSGNVSNFGSYQFVNVDNTKPVLSAVAAGSITSSGGAITWQTDKRILTNEVEYGTTISYGSRATGPGAVFLQSVALTGLSPLTLYHYRVKSTDQFGNIAVSGDFTFTTTAAGGGGGGSGDITPPAVSIFSPISGTVVNATLAVTITTSDNSGTVSGVQLKVDGINFGIELTFPFASLVNMSSLAAGAHTLTAVARDPSGNTATSAGVTFTIDRTPPAIVGVPSAGVTASSATITWTTTEPVSTFLFYGLTASYTGQVSDSVLRTSHSLQITGLAANTLYHFLIQSKDPAQNQHNSADLTFRTLVSGGVPPPPPPPPPLAPTVTLTAVPASITAGSSAILNWSSVNATSCSAPWTASTATSGSQSVSPGATTIYTITCTGSGGSTPKSVTVTVSAPAPVPIAPGGIIFRPRLEGPPALAGISFTIKVFPVGSATPIATITGSGSSFALPAGVSITAGTYDLTIETPHYLRRRHSSVSLATGIDLTLNPLLAGDLNDDQTINSLDWSLMNPRWFTSDALSDINKDGIVNSIDFSLMNRNWGKRGE